MTKLNQMIAVVNGKKERAKTEITELYKAIQRKEALIGLSRTYAPKDDDGDQLPPESKKLMVRIPDAISEAAAIWTGLFDAVATVDAANCEAGANIMVDGNAILHDVPVTHLLFLEKQLQDVHSFVSKLPTLDEAFDWEWNDAANCYSTKPTQTTRTQKVPKAFVKAEATKEHPAQVEVFTEDVLVGYWTKIDFSGAIPLQRKRELLSRVRKMQDAIKMAREAANNGEITQVEEGKAIFDYLFQDTTD